MDRKNTVALPGKLLIPMILLSVGVMHNGVARAADGLVKISSGFEYTSGDYGQNVETEILYIPVTAEYINDAWSAKLTVPYISVTGNGTVVPGGSGGTVGFGPGGPPGGGGPAPSTTTVTESGLGDVEASVAYAFSPNSDLMPFVELRAKVKFGTADEAKALGTGENDYSVQVDGVLGKGKVQPFYTLGYVMIGDTDQVDYNNCLFATAGLMFTVSDSTSLGFTYDYKQASVDNADDEGVAGFFLTSKFNQGWSATLNMTTGLTDSSLDYGGSLMVGREF